MESSKLLSKVENKFQKKGISLTQKRQKILTILLNAKQALSAYEIVDIYQKEFAQTIPAMSVYRILDFLIDIGAVHKLESINQFIVCEHAACGHTHQKAKFLICDDCHSVQEVDLDEDILDSLNHSAVRENFSLKSSQLELHGLCVDCSNN